MWITNSYAEMRWLEVVVLSMYLCGWVFCRLWIQRSYAWVGSGFLGRGVHQFLGVL